MKAALDRRLYHVRQKCLLLLHPGSKRTRRVAQRGLCKLAISIVFTGLSPPNPFSPMSSL